jgi:hypothetical protein
VSAAASWSYTSKATLWARLARDDWSGQGIFSAPVQIACDYSAESLRMTDAKGVEFTTRQIIFTERAGIKQGDMVLIGVSALSDPIAAGAMEVRAVTRYADTFDQVADDYKVLT